MKKIVYALSILLILVLTHCTSEFEYVPNPVELFGGTSSIDGNSSSSSEPGEVVCQAYEVEVASFCNGLEVQYKVPSAIDFNTGGCYFIKSFDRIVVGLGSGFKVNGVTCYCSDKPLMDHCDPQNQYAVPGRQYGCTEDFESFNGGFYIKTSGIDWTREDEGAGITGGVAGEDPLCYSSSSSSSDEIISEQCDDIVEDTNSFTCGGKTYEFVTIGTQTWMAENLNHATPSGSYCYGNLSSNCATYGRLYTWETATAVCPDGWHLPSKDEWDELIANVGAIGDAGTQLKAKSPEWDGACTNGFSALPGGTAYDNGAGSYTFDNLGTGGRWWTFTDGDAGKAIRKKMNSGNAYVTESEDNGIGYPKSGAFSVRCIKDSEEDLSSSSSYFALSSSSSYLVSSSSSEASSSSSSEELSSSSSLLASSSSSEASSSSSLVSSSSSEGLSSSSSSLALSSSSSSLVSSSSFENEMCEYEANPNFFCSGFNDMNDIITESSFKEQGINYSSAKCYYATNIYMLNSSNAITVNGVQIHCGQIEWAQPTCEEALKSVEKYDGGYYIYISEPAFSLEWTNNYGQLHPNCQ